MTATPPATTALPPTCQIRGWTVFGPGHWKGTLYSLADCRRLADNFRLLSAGPRPLLEPAVKIGHDAEGRLAASLGFPRLGTVTTLRTASDGLVSIDLDGVPTQLGALVNGDFYRDGSIELAPPLPHPEDARRILYPVFTGVSLLGDERPAVPLRFPIPRARFADGTPVPPERDLTPLAQAMAEVARSFAARSFPDQATRLCKFHYSGRAYAAQAICFSAMTPLPGTKTMTAEQKAALSAAGFTPEQIEAVEKALASGTVMAVVPPADPTAAPTVHPPADPRTMTDPGAPGSDPEPAYMSAMKKLAADHDTPEPMKVLMSAFRAFAADCTKRMSATEAAVSEMQKDKPELKAAAAFAAEYRQRAEADHKKRVEAVVDQAITEGRIEPRDRAAHVTFGTLQSDTVTLSAVGSKTPFAAWRDGLLGRKPSRFFHDALDQPTPTDNPADDPFVKAALATLPGGRPLAFSPAQPAK